MKRGKSKVPMFFLGGPDLEMATIRALILQTGHLFSSKSPTWATATRSFYEDEIKQALSDGLEPVLVELKLDIEFLGPVIDIDHHGDRAGEQASILQVLDYLEIEVTRHHMLVAANDSGYIPAMVAMGASQDEINSIRLTDRQSQGVTPEMEEQAIKAIDERQHVGQLCIVKLPHTKFATVTDRLFTTWKDGKENLLVICDCDEPDQPDFQIYYFGRGDICQLAKEKFDGFGGGQGFGKEDGQGFAGCKTDDPQPFWEFIVSYYP